VPASSTSGSQLANPAAPNRCTKEERESQRTTLASTRSSSPTMPLGLSCRCQSILHAAVQDDLRGLQHHLGRRRLLLLLLRRPRVSPSGHSLLLHAAGRCGGGAAPPVGAHRRGRPVVLVRHVGAVCVESHSDPGARPRPAAPQRGRTYRSLAAPSSSSSFPALARTPHRTSNWSTTKKGFMVSV
jgi:hypothetical protein